MAATADYSGWVRELDNYQQRGSDGEVDDPRAGPGGLRAPTTTARSGKGARLAPSQAEELQQEMKLLNWHKLANEAALKAAIIKTSKIRREDAQNAGALALEEREERAQRLQQVVEEEQLRPLEVNSAFLRDFEARGQRDEARLEDDVQRHIQHLRRLKDTMALKEDAQRRRREYRERVQELHPPPASARPPNNQEEDAQSQPWRQQRIGAVNSVYQRIAGTQARGGRANAEIAGSLDKLMELEKRIRHLEDAGLAVDALDAEPAPAGDASTAGSTNVRFAKRRSGGGPLDPPRTMYAVKPVASKARSKDALVGGGTAKRRPGPTTGAPRRGDTFLTSVPESKQRQLRRMTDRERRSVMKSDKAREAKQRALKQDVVIDGWLEKKRQAAAQRKATASLARATKPMADGKPGATTASRRLPPPTRVRAPAVGAASGKRISSLNPHMQRFDDLKRGFDRRKEQLQRAPLPNASGRGLHTRTGPQRRAPGPVASGSRLHAPPIQAQQPAARRADARSNGAALGPPQPTASGAGSRTGATRTATRLPVIARAEVPVGGRPAPRVAPRVAPRAAARAASVELPRIAGVRAPLPSPPAARNPHVPQFSRLHKR